MADDTAGAGSATGSAGTDGQQQGQGGSGAAQGDGAQGGGSGAPGAASGASGAGDKDAAGMLADAVNSPEGDGGGDGKDSADADPAAALKKAQDDYAKLQRQSRTWEQRAKDNAEKAKAHDAYVESQKTEQQKLNDRAAAAEERAEKAEAYNWRLQACVQYDLDADLMEDLRGSTEDEINASAERLAAVINKRSEAAVAAAQAKANGQQQGTRNGGSSRPVESMRPGALPASGGGSAGPNDWIRAAAASKH